MAVAAILATALTDRAVRTKGLYLDGLDVIKEPGLPGNRSGVPIDTIHVTEAGPGGVSSMEFVIDDPALSVSISDGMEVRFQDITLDHPIFFGWVQAFSVMPAFGDQGRQISVTAVGVEVVLDWAVTTVDLVFPPGSIVYNIAPAVQRIVANSVGLGPIRAFWNPATGVSSQAWPMYESNGDINTDTLTIPAGTSVREAIRMVWTETLVPFTNIYGDGARGRSLVTVDFTYGLRIWFDWLLSAPSDWLPGAFVDDASPSGGDVAENLEYSVDAAGIVRGVFVQGTGVSGLVMASTEMGPIAVLYDATITTATQLQKAATAYLASFAVGVRGSYRVSDYDPNVVWRAGSLVTIKDPRVGLATQQLFRIMQIGKTFNSSGRENWTVSFGGLPPSGAALIRRLTRDTLS